MPWVRVDDHFDEHPKLAAVGPLGWALWLAGLAYCNRNLTDGFIPWAVAPSLVPWRFQDATGPTRIYLGNARYVDEESEVTSDYVIALLVDAGIWEDDPPRGYRIHDYGDYQPTKAQVEADRAAKVAAGRAGGIAAAIARAKAPAVAAAVADGVAQSKPVPKPVPVPREGYESRENEDPPWLRSWLATRHRMPSMKQRAVLEGFLGTFDETGPERLNLLILGSPDDPIGAVLAELKVFRGEALIEAQKVEAEARTRHKAGRRKVMDPVGRELLAEWARQRGESVPA